MDGKLASIYGDCAQKAQRAKHFASSQDADEQEANTALKYNGFKSAFKGV